MRDEVPEMPRKAAGEALTGPPEPGGLRVLGDNLEPAVVAKGEMARAGQHPQQGKPMRRGGGPPSPPAWHRFRCPGGLMPHVTPLPSPAASGAATATVAMAGGAWASLTVAPLCEP